MSDLERAAEAEAEALDRFKAAYHELEQKGVGGEDRLERLQPLYEDYQQKRFERRVEERDVKMLRRGTWRGIAIAAGALFALLTAWTLQDAFTTEIGGYVAIFSRGREPEVVGERWAEMDEYSRHLMAMGCMFSVLSASCFYLVWRLSRIPMLGEEENVDG